MSHCKPTILQCGREKCLNASHTLRPGDPGWRHSPGALGPNDGSSRRLREPGRVCQQMSPAWAWSAQSSLVGPQSPDSGGASSSYTKPRAPSKWWMLWAGRALNSHPVSRDLSASSHLQPPSLERPHLWTTAVN